MVTPDPGLKTPKLPSEDSERAALHKATSFEEVVDNVLFEDIQAVGAVWRDLASVKAGFLDSEALAQALAEEECSLETNNREGRRQGEQAKNMRDLKTRTEQSILVAQYVVTAQLFGEEADIAGANEYFAVEEALYAEGQNDGQSPDNRHLTAALVEVGYAYMHALQAEGKLFNNVVEWLGSTTNPRRFAEMVEWMRSPNAEPEGEHRPLFELLARYEHDPKLQLINVFIEEWEKQPSFLQETATELLVDQAEETDADDTVLELGFSADDIAWVGFMKAALEQLGITANGDLLKSLFADADFSELPRSIQETIAASHDEQIAVLKQTYLDMLKQFARPNRFLAVDVPEHLYTNKEQRQRQSSKKRRNRSPGSGRTSISNRVISRAVEIEPVAAITEVHKVVQSEGNGYLLTELPSHDDSNETGSVETQLVDRLMASGEAASFLKRYRNDARLPTDVKNMFLSILQNPRGNGCDKIKATKLKIGEGPGGKLYPVWHLNPNKRSGLSIGELGRKTRIFYVLLPGENGEELGLLDISNKNMAEDGRLGYLF